MGNELIRTKFQLQRGEKGASAFHLSVDVNLPSKGVTAIFGQSGSGKTTFLRCVAGLEPVTDGYLEVNGEAWQSQTNNLPTHKRPLGYVFQEASLFAHLSAQGNLRYAIKRADSPCSDIDYERIIDLMGIRPILSRYPHQLSGGERQRVAIARAILIQPRVLLMDEPLASLDDSRKREILPYLAKLKASLDIPILYVSHSIDEIAQLADHVLVLEAGQVVAQGSISEIFARTDFPHLSSDDVGVVWQGKVIERDGYWHLAKVSCLGGALWVRDAGDEIGSQIRIRVLARDVSLTLNRHDDSSILNRIEVTVLAVTADSDEAMVLVRLQSKQDNMIARLTRRSAEHLGLSVGISLWAQIKSVAIVR